MFREYEELYFDLKFEGESGIAKKTGCIKPCYYKQYKILGSGDMSQTYFGWASFWAVSNDTFFESEVLLLNLYPHSLLLLSLLLGPDLPPDFPCGRIWWHPRSVPGVLLHVALGRSGDAGGLGQPAGGQVCQIRRRLKHLYYNLISRKNCSLLSLRYFEVSNSQQSFAIRCPHLLCIFTFPCRCLNVYIFFLFKFLHCHLKNV